MRNQWTTTASDAGGGEEGGRRRRFRQGHRVGQGSRGAGQGFDLPGHQREDPLEGYGNTLEHDPEKWKPVFRQDHAPTSKDAVTTRGDPHDHPPPRFPDASGRRHPVRQPAAAPRAGRRQQCGRLRSRALRQCAHPAHHRYPCAASAGVFSRAERQSRRRLDAGQSAASGRTRLPRSLRHPARQRRRLCLHLHRIRESRRADSASSAVLRI